MTLKSRITFSLVELIYTAVMVGILLALLVPALQAVRESARKTQCKDNLQQIAQACHTFEVGKGYYPTAGAQMRTVWSITKIPRETWATGEPGSWMFQILPLLKQQPIHDMRDQALADKSYVGFVSGWPSDPNNPYSAMDDRMIPEFICPSRGVRTVEVKNELSMSWVCGDYASPCGVFEIDDIPEGRTLPDGTRDPNNFLRGDGNKWGDAAFAFKARKIETNFWVGLIRASGTVSHGRPFRYERVGSSQVSRGTSYTAFAFEKSVDGSMSTIQSPKPTSAKGEALGFYSPNVCTNVRFILKPIKGTMVIGDGVQDPLAHMRTLENRGPQENLVLYELGFGTPHRNTANVAMGDGAVKEISKDISPAVFYDLCHRNEVQAKH